MKDLGRHVYGLAAMALGVTALAWGDFNPPWQSAPDGLPAKAAFAYAMGAVLLLAGAAVQWRRTAKWAALVPAAVYAVFILVWVRRIFAMPHVFGVYSGACEQLAMALGGIAVFAALQPRSPAAERTEQACRIAFGLCLMVFGAAHFVYPAETAALVPKWLPPGQTAWAYATGGLHAMAGLALLSGIQAKLAARLVTAMFVVFGVLVWIPQVLAHPEAHMAWGGNAINLALVGAAWAVADTLARRADRAAGAGSPAVGAEAST